MLFTSRPPARRRFGNAGFTIVEVLILTALVGILAVMTIGAFQTWVPRLQTRRSLEDVEQLLAQARVTAVRLQEEVVVAASPADRTLLAFRDRGPAACATCQVNRELDDRAELIGEVRLVNADFGGPANGLHGADSIDGLTDHPDASKWNVLVYRPQGSVRDAGAFRILDRRQKNHFEVAVSSFTAQVEVRKYLPVEDSPNGSPGFFEEGVRATADEQGRNIWRWY
jgi:hypothetical protein